MLKQTVYLKASNAAISHCDVVAIDGGGLALVHVTNSERKAEWLPRLKELFAKSGYAFKDDVQGEAVIAPTRGYLGTHGYLADDPELAGIFIACGNGITRGVSLPQIATLDVATTIARLLDIKLPEVEKRVLSEIFDCN